jgi:uroporphyrinogen III methyltransferase/synthase
VNGVDAFMERLRHHGLDLRAVPRETKVAAIGPATAGALEAVGLRVDVVPEEFRAEALIEAIKDGSLAGRRVLIPRAKVAREVLPEKLREAGAEVVVPAAYETVPSSRGRRRWPGSWRREHRLRHVHRELHGGELRGGLRRRRVGAAAGRGAGGLHRSDHRRHRRGFGLGVDAEAREYTIPGLIEAVVDLLATDPAQR